MRNLFSLFIVVLICSCSPQKPVSGSSSVGVTQTNSKGSKMYGKVVVKSVSDGNSEMPVLYFDRDGVEFYINIPAGKVSKPDIQKHLYKNIDVIGEIKTGSYSSDGKQMSSTREGKDSEEGAYVVFYKILE